MKIKYYQLTEVATPRYIKSDDVSAEISLKTILNKEGLRTFVACLKYADSSKVKMLNSTLLKNALGLCRELNLKKYPTLNQQRDQIVDLMKKASRNKEAKLAAKKAISSFFTQTFRFNQPEKVEKLWDIINVFMHCGSSNTQHSIGYALLYYRKIDREWRLCVDNFLTQ